MRRNFYFLLVGVLIIGGCKEDESSLKISEEELNFSYEKEDFTVQIESEIPWEATIESWKGADEEGNDIQKVSDLQKVMYFSPEKGPAGVTSVLFRAEKNDSYRTRGMSVRIKAGKDQGKILFLQHPGVYFSVFPREIQVDAGTTSEKIKFRTSRGIQLKYTDDWIKFPLHASEGELAAEMSFTILANESDLPRAGKIILETMEGLLSDTIFISQKAKNE